MFRFLTITLFGYYGLMCYAFWCLCLAHLESYDYYTGPLARFIGFPLYIMLNSQPYLVHWIHEYIAVNRVENDKETFRLFP